MKIIKYTIEPTGPWVYPLRSDTLHGLVACLAAEWEGEKACLDLLASFKDNDPFFVCSSAFPKGFLPAPVLTPISRSKFRELFGVETDLLDSLQEYKKFKKKNYIPCTVWNEHKNALSAESLFSVYMSEKKELQAQGKNAEPWTVPSQYTYTEQHLTIDRTKNKHLDGSYFGTTLNFSANELDIYVKVKSDKKEYFEKYLKNIGEYGFGADASTGKGRFKVNNQEDVSEAFASKGEYGLNLSVLSSDCLAGLEGWYKCFTKKGKTWVAKSVPTPFKKPFIAVEEGAVLKNVPKNCILQGIHADGGLVQICNALLMLCTLGESV